MTLFTFAQAVACYVFHSGAIWALELTVFLFAWLVLLGTVQLAREGRHFGIDALIGILRRCCRTSS
jgi:C4-dicarboxylate transporter DctQ subunit